MAITVSKEELPDCKVGEVVEMTVVSEKDGKFTLEPYAEEEPAKKPEKKGAKGKRPRAVQAVLDEEYGEIA